MNTCNGCPSLNRVINPYPDKYNTHHACKLYGKKLYWDEDENPIRCAECDGKPKETKWLECRGTIHSNF